MTYLELCLAMQKRTPVTLTGSGITVTGMINGIRPEDGSGKCWLVTVHAARPGTCGKAETVFVRTA